MQKQGTSSKYKGALKGCRDFYSIDSDWMLKSNTAKPKRKLQSKTGQPRKESKVLVNEEDTNDFHSSRTTGSVLSDSNMHQPMDDENEMDYEIGSVEGVGGIPIDDQLDHKTATYITNTFDTKYNSFNIEKDILVLLNRNFNFAKKKTQSKSNEIPLKRIDGSEFYMSDAVTKLHNCFLQEQLTIKARNNILLVLSEILGHSFPQYSYSDQNQHSISSLIYPVPTILSFHVCEKGDHVFVGKYSEDLKCPNKHCSELRAGKCRVSSCKDISPDMHCPHGFTYKTAKRILQYRPLTVHLQRALRYSSFYSLATCSFTSSNTDWDVMLKPVAREQMEQMDGVWNTLPAETKEGCKKLNLVVGVNYDAVKVCKHKATHFSPLLVTIFNLPPFLRYKKGVGVFCVSAFDGLTGEDYEDSEDFLISKCFVDELIMLSKGVKIKVIDENGDEQSYIVQVRVIHHGYDTSETEKTMRITPTATSYQWCFVCGGVKGGRKTEGGKTCCTGNRGFLSLNSVLRYRGQSLNCCPWGFYGEHPHHLRYSIPDKSENLNATIAEDTLNERIVSIGIGYQREIDNFRSCCINPSHQHDISRIINRNNVNFEWLHSNIIELKDFLKVIAPHTYYEHMDYRPVIPHSRITNAQYYSRAFKLFEHNANPNNTKIDDYEGVKGMYPYAKLFYSDIRKHVCWDAFHIVKNFVSKLIDLWKNERSNSNVIRAHCYKNKMHPDLYKVVIEKKVVKTPAVEFALSSLKGLQQAVEKGSSIQVEETTETEHVVKEVKLVESEPLWMISTMMRAFIDHVVGGSILLPSGTKEDFQIPSIFAATGNLNGVAKMKILVVLMDLINFCLFNYAENYCEAYLYFYKIISQDICKMMCRGFSDEAVDRLVEEVKETVSLNEGLFPLSESLAGTHQLIDIAAHIKVFGPISCWWTLGAERTVGNIGSKYVTGGNKPYITAVNRELNESDAATSNSLNLAMWSTILKTIKDVPTNITKSSDLSRTAVADYRDAQTSEDSEEEQEATYAEPDIEALKSSLNSNDKNFAKQFHKYLLKDQQNKLIVIPGDSFCEDKKKVCSKVVMEVSLLSQLLNSSLSYLASLITTGTYTDISLLRASLFFRLANYWRIGKEQDSLLYTYFKEIAADTLLSNSNGDEEFVIWMQYLIPTVKHCVQHGVQLQVIAYNSDGRPLTIDEDTSMTHLFESKLYYQDIDFLLNYESQLARLDLDEWLHLYKHVHHKGVTMRAKKLSKGNKLDDVLDEGVNWMDRDVVDSWCFVGNDINASCKDLSVGQILCIYRFSMNESCPLRKETWVLYDAFPRNITNVPFNKSFFQGLVFVDLQRYMRQSVRALTVVNVNAIFPSSLAVILLKKQSRPLIFTYKSLKNLQKGLHHHFTTNMQEVDTIGLLPLEPYNRTLDS
jgi:hypothetical protein